MAVASWSRKPGWGDLSRAVTVNMPGQSLEPPSRVGNREGWVLGVSTWPCVLSAAGSLLTSGSPG